MKREEFVNVAEEALDSLPEEFRSRIQNAAIRGFSVPSETTPTGAAKAAASGHFPRSASDEEERL
jgi:hypothetical protein